MSDTVTPEGFNTPIPAKIMTPDRVETRIGTLEFDDGFPTQATAELLFDHLDFLRGVEAFLSRRAGGVAGGDAHRHGGGRRSRPATRSASSTGCWTRTRSS